jgi:dephospho-CoA kinase
MKFQIPENEKENLADFTIKNDGSIVDLEMKTKMFLTVFESML